jgi:hypothetical protein
LKEKTQPLAEVLKKISSALDTTTDYLIYGDKDEKARAFLLFHFRVKVKNLYLRD